MKRLIALYLFAWLSLGEFSAIRSSQAGMVQAQQYEQFWIWGDISTADYLKKAKVLYILQGQVTDRHENKTSRFIRQGIAPRPLKNQRIWVVIRSQHLNWTEQDYHQAFQLLRQWQQHGNQVQGLQIDFDSKTKRMYDYALFLQQLRQKLPPEYQLSITGLMDWSNITDTRTLVLLKASIDEIAIQTYQGTRTTVDYEKYLQRMTRLGLPFKVGLVQNGQFDHHPNYQKSALFKGHIVFLLRSKPRI